MGQEVDDGGGVGVGAADVLLASLGGDKGPKLLNVESRSPLVVAEEVEVPHADLTEVTGMVCPYCQRNSIESSIRLVDMFRDARYFLLPKACLQSIQGGCRIHLSKLVRWWCCRRVSIEVSYRIGNSSSYLTTGHTTTTRVLSVLADTSGENFCQFGFEISVGSVATYPLPAETYKSRRVSIILTISPKTVTILGRAHTCPRCFLVLENRVGCYSQHIVSSNCVMAAIFTMVAAW